MFAEYIGAALKRAEYLPLEDCTFAARVDGLKGVIATGQTIEECREDLIEVIEEWITIRLERGLDIPSLDGHTIGVSRESLAVV
jgi:predicted RNase H-like HicB family nuclease